MSNNSKYAGSYSESSFWEKIRKFAKKGGNKLLENALRLYFAMKLGKATPVQIAAIIGALGYFICPIDAIPDLLPGGLADDAGVLATTVATLSCCADAMVKQQASKKAKEIL